MNFLNLLLKICIQLCKLSFSYMLNFKLMFVSEFSANKQKNVLIQIYNLVEFEDISIYFLNKQR